MNPTSRWTTGQAAEYLAGSGEPTVVDAHATRMWHHGELTQILAPNNTEVAPDLTRLDPPVVVPATRGRSWKRWAIGATAAATLAATGLLGADVIRDTNTSDANTSTVAGPGPSTVDDSKDPARDTAQTGTAPVEEQSFSADCAWERGGYSFDDDLKGNSGPMSVDGTCDGVPVEIIVDFDGILVSGVSNVTAVGTIDGLPVDLSISDDGFYENRGEYESGYTGSSRGVFAGQPVAAEWREIQELKDAELDGGFQYKAVDRVQEEVGTEGEALIGSETFQCVGPKSIRGESYDSPTRATTTGTWLPNPQLSEGQIAALCGFLADGFDYPRYEDGL